MKFDSVLDKLGDVRSAVRKRDGVRLRMSVLELSMRGLYDQLSATSNEQQLSEAGWAAVSARLEVVLKAYLSP